MKYNSKVIVVAIIGLAIISSGCTGGQDVTPIVKTLPEVQQFLKEHPNAKITVTYWSKEDVEKSEQEIAQQCDKSITPAAMYKAVISEGDLKSIAWIDAATKTLICSTTEGKAITTSTPSPTLTNTPDVIQIKTQTSTPTPTLTSTPTSTPTTTPTSITPAPTPASISLPSSKTMTVGETWNLGKGYTLATPSIDALAAPKQVWIVFSQNGHILDEKVVNEGYVYAYGNIFSTKIASIFLITNAEGVQVGAVRLDKSILTPGSAPALTPTPAPTTPAPMPILYELLQNYALSLCGPDQKNIRIQLIRNEPIYEGSQVYKNVMKQDIVVSEGDNFYITDIGGVYVNGLRVTPLIINATFNAIFIGTASNTVRLSNLEQYDRVPENVTAVNPPQFYTGKIILERSNVDIVLPTNAPCFWN